MHVHENAAGLRCRSAHPTTSYRGHVPHDLPPADGAAITGYTGIYNADGGLAGEIRYLFGHLFGSAECSLCDITHSRVRRKPQWDRMVERIGVPLVVLHRNEIDRRLRLTVEDVALPVVVAHHSNGSTTIALTAPELAQLAGSVDGLERALLAYGQIPHGPEPRSPTEREG